MYWPTSDYTKRLLNEILGKVDAFPETAAC